MQDERRQTNTIGPAGSRTAEADRIGRKAAFAAWFAEGAPIRRLIHGKVARFRRRSGSVTCEREDLEQMLALVVWQRLARFDASRGRLLGFVSRICDHALSSERRRRRAARRNGGRPALSLDASAVGTPAEEESARFEREHDVGCVLQSLSELDREFCRRRSAGASLRQLARDRGISQRQVRKQSARIRSVFVRAGYGPPHG